jgi:hypothetical protein
VRFRTLLEDVGVIYLHLLLPPNLESKLPPITQTWNYFVIRVDDPYRDRAGTFRQFLAAIRDQEKPTVHFLHSFLPHVPWAYLPSGKQYPAGGPMRGLNIRAEMWDDDAWAVAQAYQRHLLQVGFVDTLLGELVTTLEETGLYEPALIIITADHGAGFWPGESRRDAMGPHGVDVLKVPLIIKTPHQHDAFVSDCAARSIDILPTIADILRIELPHPIGGRPLLNERKPPPPDARACRVAPVSPAEAASLERKLTLFGSGTAPGRLFRAGPHGDLVGRRVSDLRISDGGHAVTLTPAVASALNPARGSPSVPALIAGTVSGRENRDPLELAVAVNGVIQAVPRSFRQGPNAVGFSAMVPEAAFRTGPNGVEVFIVSIDARGEPTLGAPRGSPRKTDADCTLKGGIRSTGLRKPPLRTRASTSRRPGSGESKSSTKS